MFIHYLYCWANFRCLTITGASFSPKLAQDHKQYLLKVKFTWCWKECRPALFLTYGGLDIFYQTFLIVSFLMSRQNYKCCIKHAICKRSCFVKLCFVYRIYLTYSSLSPFLPPLSTNLNIFIRYLNQSSQILDERFLPRAKIHLANRKASQDKRKLEECKYKGEICYYTLTPSNLTTKTKVPTFKSHGWILFFACP